MTKNHAEAKINEILKERKLDMPYRSNKMKLHQTKIKKLKKILEKLILK